MDSSPYLNINNPDLINWFTSLYTKNGFYTNIKVLTCVLLWNDRYNNAAACDLKLTGTGSLTPIGAAYYCCLPKIGEENTPLQSHVASCQFRPSPMNNCGIMEWTAPYCFIPQFSAEWLRILEAYSRYRSKSLVICSDKIGGAVNKLIATYGVGYHTTPFVWNRNYVEKDHYICLHCKDIGEADPKQFGFI